MKKYLLIIFDLDGTLADTSKGIIDCHIHANECMGHPIHNPKILDNVIGAPLLKTYQTYFGYSEDNAKKAVEIYRKHYQKAGTSGCELYPDMEYLLKNLKTQDYFLAVATLKQEELAKNILSYLGIYDYFNIIHGMDSNDTLTKQKLLEICINRLNVEKNKAVLIGDTEHDALGAEALGIDFIGVTYGFGFKNKEDVSKYKNVGAASSAKEINDILENKELINKSHTYYD